MCAAAEAGITSNGLMISTIIVIFHALGSLPVYYDALIILRCCSLDKFLKCLSTEAKIKSLPGALPDGILSVDEASPCSVNTNIPMMYKYLSLELLDKYITCASIFQQCCQQCQR